MTNADDGIVLTEFKSEIDKDGDLLAQAVMLEAQNIRYRQTLLTIFKTLTKDDEGNLVVKLEGQTEEGNDKYLNVFVFISHLLETPMPKRTTLEIISNIQQQCVLDFMIAISQKLNEKLPGTATFRDGFKGALKWLLKCFNNIKFEVPPTHD